MKGKPVFHIYTMYILIFQIKHTKIVIILVLLLFTKNTVHLYFFNRLFQRSGCWKWSKMLTFLKKSVQSGHLRLVGMFKTSFRSSFGRTSGWQANAKPKKSRKVDEKLNKRTMSTTNTACWRFVEKSNKLNHLGKNRYKQSTLKDDRMKSETISSYICSVWFGWNLIDFVATIALCANLINVQIKCFFLYQIRIRLDVHYHWVIFALDTFIFHFFFFCLCVQCSENNLYSF